MPFDTAAIREKYVPLVGCSLVVAAASFYFGFQRGKTLQSRQTLLVSGYQIAMETTQPSPCPDVLITRPKDEVDKNLSVDLGRKDDIVQIISAESTPTPNRWSGEQGPSRRESNDRLSVFRNDAAAVAVVTDHLALSLSSNAPPRRTASMRRQSLPRSVSGFTRLTSSIGDEEGPINSSGLLTRLPRKPVWRIALTGGPCSGKSSSVMIIRDQLINLGFRVFLVPEVATILINGGLDFACMTKEKRLMQQQVILQTILMLEDGFYELASFDPKPSILLCDRGTMDGKAYCTGDEWKELLRNSDSSAEEIRDTRYDAVIHLVTTAIGAEEHYTLSNNAARREGIDQAAELDAKTLQAWIGHKTIAIVDNKKGEGFDDKVARCASFMKKLVGVEPITCVAPLPRRSSSSETIVLDVRDPALAVGCYCLVSSYDATKLPVDSMRTRILRKKLAPSSGMLAEMIEARTSEDTGITLYFHSGEMPAAADTNLTTVATRNRSSRRITEEEFAILSSRELSVASEHHISFVSNMKQWTLISCLEVDVTILRATCGEDAVAECPPWIILDVQM